MPQSDRDIHIHIHIHMDTSENTSETGVSLFYDGKVIAVAHFHADDDVSQIVKKITAAPDMYQDLLYLISIIRTIPPDMFSSMEEHGEIDLKRVAETLRKAGYEHAEWPLRKVPEEGSIES